MLCTGLSPGATSQAITAGQGIIHVPAQRTDPAPGVYFADEVLHLLEGYPIQVGRTASFNAAQVPSVHGRGMNLQPRVRPTCLPRSSSRPRRPERPGGQKKGVTNAYLVQVAEKSLCLRCGEGVGGRD